ncbi:hypothetical protein [Bacillus norwichensis]|uniref:DUF3896 domain-containing protein n=1 Tax=Bacillus norwichensis TaxID=2762217 RepID=A0ABR8VM65_9BACI|nr:hypothetical protein [Bacillus norwichensis]MBD8005851.1 hypothetical protein [Bacillus norwichensis]
MKVAKSKLGILQEELRDRYQILKEDIDDSHTGDEYDIEARKEQLLEIKFLEKTLNRIWEIKNS